MVSLYAVFLLFEYLLGLVAIPADPSRSSRYDILLSPREWPELSSTDYPDDLIILHYNGYGQLSNPILPFGVAWDKVDDSKRAFSFS